MKNKKGYFFWAFWWVND